jgi:Ni/Fe-hydrogenase subunit HybB-like protein
VTGLPWIVSLAYVLPAMHQSSLGALMLLGGTRVSPLWQTPFLPLLYVWAAAFLGFAFVSATLLFCSVMWNRALDVDVLTEMSRVTAWIIGTWLAFRLVDLTVRRQIVSAFQFNIFALLFWLELAVLGAALWTLRDSVLRRSPRTMFYGALLAVLGGMLYRFDPTTTAFQPKPGAIYFPSVIELLISLGFMAMGVAIFIFLAKILSILPGPVSLAKENEVQRLKEARLQRFAVRSQAGHFVAGD